MKKTIKEKLTPYILGILFLIAICILLYSGYKLAGSDIDDKFDDCDEYCFHQAKYWMSPAIGFTFDGRCICEDGSVGWFDEEQYTIKDIVNIGCLEGECD